jgi:hypothetical protein
MKNSNTAAIDPRVAKFVSYVTLLAWCSILALGIFWACRKVGVF